VFDRRCVANGELLQVGDEIGQPDAVRAELGSALGTALANKVADSVADLQRLAVRDAASIERLSDELDEPDPIVVPMLDGDVTDVAGLLALYRHLDSA